MKRSFVAAITLFLLINIGGCQGGQIRGDFSDKNWLHDGLGYYLKEPLNMKLNKFSLGAGVGDPHIIGEAKTGMFNSKSVVVSDIPMQDIVYNALKDAFSKMGFVIVDERNSADLITTGQISQFWSREFANGWTPEYAKAAVRYDLVIRDNNDKVFWAKSVDVEEKSTGIGVIFDATSSVIPTLKKALSQSIFQVVNDANFQAALNKIRKNAQALESDAAYSR